jgi:heme exporter protein D
MMPDLGKYAGAVAWSYVASVVLLAALVALSLWQSARVKRALREVDARQEKPHG